MNTPKRIGQFPTFKFLSISLVSLVLTTLGNHEVRAAESSPASELSIPGFTDACNFGLSTNASGMENKHALQRAVDQGGTIVVSRPGIYPIAGTVYLGSDTTVIFGNGVLLKKVVEPEPFSHVLLNKGALTKTYDHHITVKGLQIVVNGVDINTFKDAYGLRGQLAFFYAKDVRIEGFRCLDLGAAQFGIHVCTFEDLVIDDVIIKGQKDGVHLGCGKRFTIRNGVFATGDDAVALNAHDYATSNPELGWIEDGLIENCHDLAEAKNVGYFCRILAGAWIDWRPGLEVQQSDTVVSDGRLYRVQMQPDGKVFKSVTKPTFPSGSEVLDGIRWGVVQTNVTYTAGVRNVTFRDLFLEKPRTAFSVHFDIGKWSRSYYPGAEIPVQQQLVFDSIRMLGNQVMFSIGTPVDVVSIRNSSLKNNQIQFRGNGAMKDYLKTEVSMLGCVFNHAGAMDLIVNSVANKEIHFQTSGSVATSDKFSARIVAGGGKITTDSDLSGLKK